MSGDVTIGALQRQTYLPDRDASENGLLIAGQYYYDVYFTGGAVSGITLSGLTAPLGIVDGGSGQDTANGALNAFLPSQAGNAGKSLVTDGTNATWQTSGSGTVTSVAFSGGTTGLTVTGSPITTSGTITLEGILSPTNGGFGVANNAASTLAISGNFATTLTVTGATGVTLPTTGTLATLAGTEVFTNKTISGATNTISNINLASQVTGDLPFANLAQGSARSVLAVAGNATADFASVQGTANQTLVINSAGTALAFGQLNLASSSAVTGSLAAVNGGSGLATALAPQCGYLAYSSATAITFTPKNGSWIKINGLLYEIPSAGIAGGANTSVFVNGSGGSNLASSTLYYVYAFNNSGTVTFDFSTTTHARSTTAGNVGTEIKSGDDTRTFLGLIYTNSSSQFADTGQTRHVASWFNPEKKLATLTYGSSRTLAGSPWTEYNSSDRISWVTIASRPVDIQIQCTTSLDAVAILYIGVGIDGTAIRPIRLYAKETSANAEMNMSASNHYEASEGYHYSTIIGGVGSGTATIYATYTTHSVIITG